MSGQGNFVTTPASSAPPVVQPSLYLTVGQFFERYDRRTMSQLSNDNGNGIPVENNIQQLIYDAEGELEMTIGDQYRLPISQVPTPFKRFVAARVAWTLYGRRSDKPAAIKDENAWADKFLEDIRLGKIVPTGQTPQGVTVTQLGPSGNIIPFPGGCLTVTRCP